MGLQEKYRIQWKSLKKKYEGTCREVAVVVHWWRKTAREKMSTTNAKGTDARS